MSADLKADKAAVKCQPECPPSSSGSYMIIFRGKELFRYSSERVTTVLLGPRFAKSDHLLALLLQCSTMASSLLALPHLPHHVSHPYLTSHNTLIELYFSCLRRVRKREDSYINYN
ncbi:hypothetical protein ILYODFUR_021709 [Ilyodon furcidens]|uniref:Uncharacterized protein n=1 Tax=Ilyodon furcidens TaxID=33524 RepID=A0ABV0SZ66_9TELE